MRIALFAKTARTPRKILQRQCAEFLKPTIKEDIHGKAAKILKSWIKLRGCPCATRYYIISQKIPKIYLIFYGLMKIRDDP